MTENVWQVERQGRRIGPISMLELALAAKARILEPEDRIWKPGLPKWFVAADVPGLLPPSPHHTAKRTGPPWFTASTIRSDEQKSNTPTRHGNRLRFLADEDPSAKRAAATGTAIAPINRSNLPALPSFTPNPTNATMTRRLADTITHYIALTLDRNGIATLDDIASNDRLKAFAGTVFDAIPGSVRVVLGRTVGRTFVEDRVFEVLLSVRASLPPQTRTSDLRVIIPGYAPFIAESIDTALVSAKQSAGSAVASTWNSALNALWRKPEPTLHSAPTR